MSTFQQFLANPHLLVNTYIDKHTIHLVSVLGFGAYGIVYRGRHVTTGNVYAVKLLSQKKGRFSEVELHRCLSDHHGILTLEKVIQQGEWTFLVLEYASDGDLFTAITQPASPIVGNNDAIRHIFLQTIDAVQYCHQNGVAHRDLKPENILMFPNWQVKLADFGLATTQTVSADFGCGSVFYFSPESQGGFIRNNTRIKGYGTQQNDVWSLGIILINLAAGRNPWKQASIQDPAFAAYARKPSQFFKGILPCISNELNSILERIFCLDPALRISLPELRLRIIQCKSFTTKHELSQTRVSTSVRSDDIPKYQWQQERIDRPATTAFQSRRMECSESTAVTMLQYINGYIDDGSNEHYNDFCMAPQKIDVSSALHIRGKKSSGLHVQPPTTKATSPTPPTPSCSSSSCSSASSTASDCPSTPRIITTAFGGITEKQQQLKHFMHHQSATLYQWSLEH